MDIAEAMPGPMPLHYTVALTGIPAASPPAEAFGQGSLPSSSSVRTRAGSRLGGEACPSSSIRYLLPSQSQLRWHTHRELGVTGA